MHSTTPADTTAAGESTQTEVHEHVHIHGPGCSHHHEALKPVVRNAPKLGRNDPCSCGSQKKFKKCCGQ